MLSRVARVARLQPSAARLARLDASPIFRSQLVFASWSRGYARDHKAKPPRSGKPSEQYRSPDISYQKVPSPSSASTGSFKHSDATTSPKRVDSQTTPTPYVQGGKTSPSDSENGKVDSDQPPSGSGDGAKGPGDPMASLPDLTKGIPSTLAYEMAGATSRSALSEISEAEAAAGGGGRGRGELPASAYISSTERRRQNLANRMFFAFIALTAGGIVYLGRNWDEYEEARHLDAPNGWGLGLWWNRAMTRTREVLTYYHEPAFDKLLPDTDPSFERPYTLCISLEDMLVHSEWTREHGWRVAKRPGADYFLRYLSQYYELVLFTTVPFAFGEPLVRKLDPYRFIMWPLYREATKFTDGEIVKDLSYLNRDLSKVIIIDTNAAHVRNQPENAIVLPKWEGDAKDKELVGLIPFLEYIHTMQYGDVRKVLKSFEGKHIPTEFARREAIARAEFQKQLGEKGGRKSAPSGMGLLGNMLGLKPSNMSIMVSPDGEPNPSEAFAQGKMLQDIARERGQRNYELLEREIRENGEKWLKEEAALMEKANQEAKDSMMSSFAGMFVSPIKKDSEEGDKK